MPSTAWGDPLAMDELHRQLDEAESLIASEDPYTRQWGYSTAARVHGELSRHTDDPLWATAATMAGERYAALAARTRFEHAIPTVAPRAEAHMVHLGRCAHCGRPWQGSLAGACAYCPHLVYGATPTSREHARRLNDAQPVDLDDLDTPAEHDEY